MEAPPRRLAPMIAVLIAVLMCGTGVAQAKKKNHKLSVDYKTAPVSVIDEPTANTVEFSDDAKLVGRPFGNLKAHLDEDSLLTYNQAGGDSARTDYSGSYHVTFTAAFYSGAGGKFRGFYDYAVDVNGDPSGPITGSITGGAGPYKGAKGRFQVVDFQVFHPESVQYKGHWQGSIRY
jgi:hypothetical protein